MSGPFKLYTGIFMKINSMVRKNPTLLFLSALLFSTVCRSEEKDAFRLEPLAVSQVTESTALGYGNGRKLISDPDGRIYFSAVSKAPNGLPGVCVIRTVQKDSAAPPTFESIWIENSNGLFVSADMHFASSLGGFGAGPFYVVWAGGDRTNLNDPKLANQVRFAKVDTSSTMKVVETGQPFTVKGFEEAYQQPYRSSQYWQEFPSAFVSKEGRLHVVWEARDPSRRTVEGKLVPGIAYAVRDTAGHWSVQGDIDAPPYLDVKSVSGGQFRPFMLSDSSDTMHVLCYGDVHNRLQILYGRLINGVFSGWEPIAPSRFGQRHVSAAIDHQGRIHAVWREAGPPGQASSIAYSMREVSGTWTPAMRVNDSSSFGSTPNITVDDNAAYVIWTGWTEGFENSDHQKNNGFPNDNDTVEGRLEFAYRRFSDDHFSTPILLTGGTVSYPRLARVGKKNPSKLAAIWTSGRECLPKSCIAIYFSEFTAP